MKNVNDSSSRTKISKYLKINKNNIGLMILFVLIFITIYGLVYKVKEINTEMSKISQDNNLGAMMTIDGLLTTATFAFISFISISPNSSGSSISMNRVAWKGIWIFRYSFLLILSVLITILNFVLGYGDFTVLVGVGTILSGVILIVIIIKYTSNNKNLNVKSAKKIAYIITNPYSEKSFNKAFRNLIHPLRSTGNADFIKEILISKPFINTFANLVADDAGLIVDKKDIDYRNTLEEQNAIIRKALFKLFIIIRSNSKLSDNEKMEIGIWIQSKFVSDKIKYNWEISENSDKIFGTYYKHLVDNYQVVEFAEEIKQLIEKTGILFQVKQFSDSNISGIDGNELVKDEISKNMNKEKLKELPIVSEEKEVKDKW